MIEINVKDLAGVLDGAEVVSVVKICICGIHVILIARSQFRLIVPPNGEIVDTHGLWGNLS